MIRWLKELFSIPELDHIDRVHEALLASERARAERIRIARPERAVDEAWEKNAERGL